MRINLHVERLMLEGLALAPPEQRRLQDTVAGELERLLREGGLGSLPDGDLAIRRLPAAPVALGAPVDPVALGEAIARSLYGGLAR
jgi:hypothetical protein